MNTKFKHEETFIIVFKILAALAMIAMILLSTSCATPRYKKDCRGNYHTKQKGGFYL